MHHLGVVLKGIQGSGDSGNSHWRNIGTRGFAYGICKGLSSCVAELSTHVTELVDEVASMLGLQQLVQD